jgi:ribosomal protein S18 acetylase RimI-like enzyme
MSSSPLRELRAGDEEAVARLFVECFGESRQVDAEEIRSWLDNAEFDRDWFRVLEADGRVAGYGDIWPQDDELVLDIAARDRWDVFLDWAEDIARAKGLPRVRTAPPAGHELAHVCELRGYRYWRSSFTMEITLEEAPTAALPDGLTATEYSDQHEERLIATLNDSFAADPFWHAVSASNFREFYLRSRGFDPELWTLAWDGDALAGYSLAYFQHGADDTIGWVGTLGVREPWRRRGLGEALLRTSFAKIHARGLRRAGLGVDAENVTGALRLYERAGMRKVGQTDDWVLDLQ